MNSQFHSPWLAPRDLPQELLLSLPLPSLSNCITGVRGGSPPQAGGQGQQGRRTLTDVVEASGGQALWQVRGVEERGQESHDHVLLVVQGGFILCTLPWEQEQLQVFKRNIRS